jgi:uncharacterized membrane protein YhaH (DUF805 family)
MRGVSLNEMGPLLAILTVPQNVIFVWAFIELFCLRGTPGDNRFGRDPLAART